MLLKIPRLYDSHVHWLVTGQIETGLKLFDLKSAADIEHVKIEPHFFRGEWLVGWGWDHTKWPGQTLPTKDILDRVFPNHPVFLSRVDGHCSWLNTLALEKLGYECSHSGILLEEDHFNAYFSLPKYSDQQIRGALKKAIEMFHQAGFTHIRDMTCEEPQWHQVVQMDQAGELSLYVQENFLCEKPADLDRILVLLEKTRTQETAHVKVQGVKIFFDGTLGSNTALLSKCNCSQHKSAWGQSEDLENLFRKTWARGFEVSVHTIGDEAVHQVVSIARKVMATNELTGWLNLEHVEVLRPETLQMMKALHVRCHMQPCHWLSDRQWLKEKLDDLYKYAFPWGAISKSGIPLQFGSDTPVARSSYWDNDQALRESVKEKIPALKGQIEDYHIFPSGGSDTYTVFEDQKVKELVFDGKRIF